MKMEQIRYIVELKNAKSINKAAANLYISQPNLSREIRALETELGCDLIERRSQGAVLTEAGKKFVEYAESVLNQFDKLRTIAVPDTEGGDFFLSVASSRFNCTVVAAAEIIEKYRAMGKHLRVDFIETSRDQVIDAVSAGTARIGFVSIPSCYNSEIMNKIRSRGLVFEQSSQDHPAICIGKKNPLFNKKENWVTPEELKGFPQICFENRDFYHFSDIERILGIYQTADRIVVNSRGVQTELVKMTDGYTVYSAANERRRVAFDEKSDTRIIPLKDSRIVTRSGFIIKENMTLNDAEIEYIELIKRKSETLNE